jgi:hypothetical protein
MKKLFTDIITIIQKSKEVKAKAIAAGAFWY